MGNIDHYFLLKLSDINHRITVHEGKAVKQLESQSRKILFHLLPSACPGKYKEQLIELRNIISDNLRNGSPSESVPIKLENLNTKQAEKYIKLLEDIENHIDYELDKI